MLPLLAIPRLVFQAERMASSIESGAAVVESGVDARRKA